MTVDQFINFINHSEEMIMSDQLNRLFGELWRAEWRHRVSGKK